MVAAGEVCRRAVDLDLDKAASVTSAIVPLSELSTAEDSLSLELKGRGDEDGGGGARDDPWEDDTSPVDLEAGLADGDRF